MSPQCVSCNNQPNDNDSLGGAASEGTVTPVVIGIIVGTVGVFVLVLCALFYCVKLENERSMRVKDDDDEEHEPASSSSEAGHRSPAAMTAAGFAAPVSDADADADDYHHDRQRRHHHHQQHHQQHDRFGPKAADLELDRRRHSSPVTVGAGRESRAGVAVGAVVGKTRGLFGWGGKKRGSSGGLIFLALFAFFSLSFSSSIVLSLLSFPLSVVFILLCDSTTLIRPYNNN